MAQMKAYTFTAAAQPVNKDIEIGFEPKVVKVTNLTNWATSGGSQLREARWFDGMDQASASVVNGSGTGLAVVTAAVTTNGISYLESSSIGSAISAFTNANPGVITIANLSLIGVAAGDTIKVSGVADDNSGTSLNGTYTVASVSGNTITTATNTSAYSVWVSGGTVVRISDTNGDPIPTQVYGRRLVRIGTSAQSASAVLYVEIYGDNNVV
jgi:hypothetical protein